MTDSRDALHEALEDFAGTHDLPVGPERLRARVAAATAIRVALAAGPVVPVVRTLPLVSGPVPRAAALGRALRSHAPFVQVRHGAILLQCLHEGAPRTMVWNPTDVRHALAIPAFDRMRRGVGRIAAGLFVKVEPAITAQLDALGVRADAVDVIAYDQLDAQYPSAMLARFPRARLAITPEEWARIEQPSARDAAFIVHAPEIDRARVASVERSWIVGDGALLLHVGGRRPGQLALVVNSARGVFVASGNALTVDGYVSAGSPLPGLREFARTRPTPFVGAYPDVGRDPSEAMAVEYALSDRHPLAPAYPFILPTVELVASAIAPGISPGAMAPVLALGTVMRA